MLVHIIILLVGFIIGYTVSNIVRKSKFIGTLYLTKHDNEDPSLYLELNGAVDVVSNKDIVHMQVRTLRDDSQK